MDQNKWKKTLFMYCKKTRCISSTFGKSTGEIPPLSTGLLWFSPRHQPASHCCSTVLHQLCAKEVAPMRGGGHQESPNPLSQVCENMVEYCFCSQQEEQETTSELEPGVTCKILLWSLCEGLQHLRCVNSPGSLQTPRGIDNHPLFLEKSRVKHER